MLRAIHEIRPGWIVGENVGGILQVVQPGKAAHVGCQPSLFGEDQPVYRKREEYVVETICRDLEREGYTVLPEIIREMLLPTPTATEIHHWQRVERWKRQGRTSMHETEDGEKNPNGLTDFLDFHGLLPTLEHIGRKGKNPRQGGLPDFFAQTGRSFQLNPLFVAEMMGFPTSWTVLPFLPGGSSPSRDTGTPSSPR